jgi:glycosyltransferase involved in cell wall biosynthesis
LNRTPFSISVVLPCHEEAEILERLVGVLLPALQGCSGQHEILVVADGAATDGTPEMAAKLEVAIPCLRRILQPADDPGYGRAISLGVAAARFPWVLILDADGQLDPEELPRLTERAPAASVVIGVRTNRADAWPRRAAGAFYTAVVRVLLGLGPVKDLDCGFKLVEKRRLGLAPLKCRTGAVNAEILARAMADGALVAQVPVSHGRRWRGRSRFEVGGGVLPQAPHPIEALAIARDVGLLFVRRFVGPVGQEV